jgi:hypothetical protein
MEFEDLQLIWSEQDRQPLYAINQEALHKRIRAKLQRSQHIASVNEIGLVCIFLAASLILLFLREFNWLNLLPIGAMLGVSGYILSRRHHRQKLTERFEPTMLGDLENAIAQQKHIIREARTFLFWNILPIAAAVVAKMAMDGEVRLWKWIFIPGSFILAYLVARLAPRKHLRKMKSLQLLREKLVGEN